MGAATSSDTTLDSKTLSGLSKAQSVILPTTATLRSSDLKQSKDKRALVIGINYYGSDNKLNGCVNDAQAIYHLLVTQYNYDPANVLLLVDSPTSEVTRNIIISALQWLLSSSPAKDYHPNGIYPVSNSPQTMFFHYSGHGIQQSGNSLRVDNEKEAIVPSDFRDSGFIYDYELRTIINKTPKDSSLSAIMDCCYSEDNLDLKYNTEGNSDTPVTRIIGDFSETEGDVIMISACLDNQTDADTSSTGASDGALTSAILANLGGQQISCSKLLSGVTSSFTRMRIPQIASISFGRMRSLEDPFCM